MKTAAWITLFKCSLTFTMLNCFIGCQRSHHQAAQVMSEQAAAAGDKSEAKFMIGQVVAGNTQTKVIQPITPASIRDEFHSVRWMPGTEVTIQTKTEVITISRKESGELVAQWAQDLGNDKYRFSSCCPIAEDQALDLLVSLNARDGKHTTIVKWIDDP